MKTISTLKSKIYLVVFNLCCFVAMAQNEDPGFPGEDPGTPAAPIDDWVLPMLGIGLLLMGYYFKKHKKADAINPQQKVE